MEKAQIVVADESGLLFITNWSERDGVFIGENAVSVDGKIITDDMREDFWPMKCVYDPTSNTIKLSGIEKPKESGVPVGDHEILAAALPLLRAQAAQAYDDARLIDAAALFVGQEWAAGKDYAAKEVLTFEGQMYQVEQAHTSQAHQLPGSDGMLAIYRLIRVTTEGEVLPWVSGEAVEIGDRRECEGVVYEVYAAAGANIWTPDTVPAIWRVVE